MSARLQRRGTGDGERWFLINAQTGREQVAAEQLRRQGYRPFLPSMQRSVHHARRIRTVAAAYFPGYLFVPLDLNRHRWRSIDGTVGVIRIVKANDRPLAAPKGLVESLIAATGADGVLDLAPTLRPGTHVRVISGPFAGQLAIVDGLNASNRVSLLLSMMNQTVSVEMPRRVLAEV